MSLKDHSVPISPGLVLSIFCLLLYSAGFIRIETKLNDYERRLKTVEEVIRQDQIKQLRTDFPPTEQVVHTSYAKLEVHRQKRSISHPSHFNNSVGIRKMMEDIVSSALKICHSKAGSNACPRGRPGPPGRAGAKGDKGRKGRKGPQGIMGPPGKSGKQGIMGTPGIRGEKGMKGDIGPPGIPGTSGTKGEPGEPISTPKVSISPPKLIVNETNTASLLCSASGNPAAQISWSKINGSFPSRTRMASDGQVQIIGVRMEDAGEYKCVARNILGRDEQTSSLVVQSKPKVSLLFGPTYVERGKNVTLPECHVTGFPPAGITWSKVHGEFTQSRVTIRDGQLSITHAQKGDFGLYKCKASNILGDDSALTHLSVYELPHFTKKPPDQLHVRPKQNISISCQATGDTKPKVTWVRENNELPVGRSQVSVNGTLQIWNIEDKDSGIYTCTATSGGLFKTSSLMQLTVAKVCEPVGVTDRNRIPDARMTASSQFYSNTYHPYYGRLNESRGSGAWCTKTGSDRTDYLQVDLGAVHIVCAVATQGNRMESQRTTTYKVRLSTDGIIWNTYKETDAEKVFQGNSDQSSIVKHFLRTDFKARYIRFYPVTHHRWPCLRVEIFVLK